MEHVIDGIKITITESENTKKYAHLFTYESLALLSALHEEMNHERNRLLNDRFFLYRQLETGHVSKLVDLSNEVKQNWKIANTNTALMRKVDICCAADNDILLKRLIQHPVHASDGLNIVVDFEDSMKHHWDNLLSGLNNIKAILSPAYGGSQPLPGLSFRIRSLADSEENVLINNEPVCAGLFDLVMSFCLATEIFNKASITYYIPQCEHYMEARWWNEILLLLENFAGLPENYFKTLFIIETLPAAYQVEAILYETRTRTIGMCAGYRDKITSDLRIVTKKVDFVLPERIHLDMQNPYIADFAQHVIAVCHKHGALAIGGLTLNASGKIDDVVDAKVLKNNDDIQTQQQLGFDGCWVSHPDHIAFAMEIFNTLNQLQIIPDGFYDTPDMLNVAMQPVTMEGLRDNIRTAITFLQAYKEGYASIILDNRLEDVSTFELIKTQVVQWYQKGVVLDGGEKINNRLITDIILEESDKLVEVLRTEFEGNPTGELGAIFNTYKKAALDFEQMIVNSVSSDLLYEKNKVLYS